MDSTSPVSRSGAKPGERFSSMGTPSTTNSVWFSEPRGCNTALASKIQPGCMFTRSIKPRRRILGEDRMELDGVVAQPAPPVPMVRLARPDECPERRAVAEHAQVAKLVDDGRFQGLWRRE